MSKKILGLDIGTTSIGWAIVEATDEKKINEYTNEFATTDINNDRIGIYKDAIGVRIISQDTSSVQSFNKGQKLTSATTSTPTANRRKKRGMRRLKSRYKLRRGKLHNVLDKLNMLPDGINKIQNIKGKMEFIQNENGKYYTAQKGKRENNDIGKVIYELRDRAIREKISLQELGRILLHLNQWRGYSSDRFSVEEKPKFDYFIAELIEVGFEKKIPHFEKDKKDEHKYYQIEVKLKFANPLNLGDLENSNFVSELHGFIFKKEIDFKVGDFITIKKPEFKQDKKGKTIISEYYKITLTTPDPTDWNYKYQNLQKTLTEWCNDGKTLGSYFYYNFYENKTIDRIRNNVVNRNWYEQEFDKIWDLQFEKHKDFFEKINIDEIVKIAFKDYQAVLNEVKKKNGIKEQLRCLIKDKIIFYQRPWQQAKNKGQCPFEKKIVKKEQTIKGTGEKKIVDLHIGRTVIPRSHPLFQEFKIWQQINNVRIFLNRPAEKIDLFADAVLFYKYVGKEIAEVKQMLYDALQESKTLSWRTFVKDQLKLNTFEDLESIKSSKNKTENKGIDTETGEIVKTYFSVNFRKPKKDRTWEYIKLKGNTTKVSLQKILTDKTEEWFNSIYKKSNDNHNNTKSEIGKYNYKDCEYIVTNFQLLWETIYDITILDEKKLKENIKNKFPNNIFTDEQLNALSKLKFEDAGMGNLSAKAIRQILPLMSNGNNLTLKASDKIKSLIDLNNSEEEKIKNNDEKLEGLKNFITDKKARVRLSQFKNKNDFTYLNYWEAIAVVYGSHSTKNTIIKTEISRVENHSMNNPVVEKIVNETISIVNDIYKIYGFDEVRIELSRELKASMEERQQIWESMNNNAERNDWAKKMLRELKKAIIEDSRNADNIDDSTSINSNIDKIKIIEDVVKYQKQEEYEVKFKEFKLGEPSNSEITKYLLWLEQNFKCPYTNQPIPLTDVFAKGKIVQIEHIIPKERYYLNSYVNKVITWSEVNQAKANNGNRTAFEFIVSKRVEDKIEVGNTLLPLVAKESWEEHVNSMFPKGGKRTNLLRKEIQEDPINRTLNETQYINKKLKEKLAELVDENKVWTTTGSVTDILRERWHLNDVMKELMRNRFENFEIPTGKKTFTLKTIEEQEKMIDKINEALKVEPFKVFKIPFGKTGDKFIEIKEIEELKTIQNNLQDLVRVNIESTKNPKPYKYETTTESTEIKNLTYWTKEYKPKLNEYIDVEKFEGFSKRLDHRHHALDAIIIACTKQNHIQYINTLNAINTADQERDESKKAKYAFIKSDVCIGDSSNKFITPWSNNKFIVDVKNVMNKIVVSHKNTKTLISPSKNKFEKNISIRGELHLDTNYARKNYFQGDRTKIKKLIPFLFELKQENQYQSKVHFKNFKEIICETVLIEKYQNILIPLFEKYEIEKLNDSLCKEYSKKILYEINTNKLLYDTKKNKPLDWLSTYNKNDKSVRPNGLSMDLNSKTAKIDEVKSIADPRIKRIAEYRRNLIIKRKSEIDLENLPKTEKEKRKREIEALPLYSNAIYEVRVKIDDDTFRWVEIKDFDWHDFEKIEYTKKKTTQLVINKLREVDFENFKASYFDKPIFLSSIPIPIKKVRQKAYFQDLYEVTKGRYVYSPEMFMTYFFKNKNDENAKRKIKFLKFIDAVNIVNTEKPNKIDFSKLIEKDKTNDELLENVQFDLLFTLIKNDLVYLPDDEENIEIIDWDNFGLISKKLFIVKDMNHSQKLVVFQQFYKADSINISEADAKSLFKNKELKKQTEEVKYGVVEMLQSCIKVFTDKLGKKIVPFWEFKNGCWDKERAIELGLILK